MHVAGRHTSSDSNMWQFETKVQVFIASSQRSSTLEAENHRPNSWQNALTVSMSSVKWTPLTLSHVVQSFWAHFHIMHVFCRFVSDGFRNIHITMLLSNIDRSICFLQVLYSSHHCHRASRGADLVIRVELLSTVPCPMDSASQYLTMFRYLIMPFVFARAAIRYWQLRYYWKWDSNNYTSTQLSS